jgi:hypothetical protein
MKQKFGIIKLVFATLATASLAMVGAIPAHAAPVSPDPFPVIGFDSSARTLTPVIAVWTAVQDQAFVSQVDELLVCAEDKGEFYSPRVGGPASSLLSATFSGCKVVDYDFDGPINVDTAKLKGEDTLASTVGAYYTNTSTYTNAADSYIVWWSRNIPPPITGPSTLTASDISVAVTPKGASYEATITIPGTSDWLFKTSAGSPTGDGELKISAAHLMALGSSIGASSISTSYGPTPPAFVYLRGEEIEEIVAFPGLTNYSATVEFTEAIGTEPLGTISLPTHVQVCWDIDSRNAASQQVDANLVCSSAVEINSAGQESDGSNPPNHGTLSEKQFVAGTLVARTGLTHANTGTVGVGAVLEGTYADWSSPVFTTGTMEWHLFDSCTGGNSQLIIGANTSSFTVTSTVSVAGQNGQSIISTSGKAIAALTFASNATEYSSIFSQRFLVGTGFCPSSATQESPSADVVRAAPYTGPVVTTPQITGAVAGGKLTIPGANLSGVSKVEINGLDATVTVNSDGELEITVPAGLAAGTYDLVIVSSAGRLVVQNAIVISGSATGTSTGEARPSTKRLVDDSVKVWVFDVAGAGKVQIFVNGKEIAWVNATDANDSKLFNGYLVRTVELAEGKNVIEVFVDGERVDRKAYTR